MRKILSITLAVALSVAVQAQTMNVVTGDITYQFAAQQAGEMPYLSGTSVTIQGKTFTVADVSKIYIDESTVTDNTVSVTFDGNSAKVTVAGNVAKYVTPTVDGAHVTIAQSEDLSAENAGEITYILSGNSSDGAFSLSGSYKTTIELNGLTLTNASGAALDIQDGKRIAISVKKDTENTLTDCANGEQKACLVVKGHAELKGKGTLNIYGHTGHGIKSGDYLSVKNCTLNILSAEKDGIHSNEYFLLESGTVSISNVGDDGIQAELDGTASTGMTDGHEDEDTGNIYLEDGTLTIAVSAAAAKGLKSSGDIHANGGTITVSTSGVACGTATTARPRPLPAWAATAISISPAARSSSPAPVRAARASAATATSPSRAAPPTSPPPAASWPIPTAQSTTAIPATPSAYRRTTNRRRRASRWTATSAWPTAPSSSTRRIMRA